MCFSEGPKDFPIGELAETPSINSWRRLDLRLLSLVPKPSRTMATQYFEPSYQQHQQNQHFSHREQMHRLSAHYADMQSYAMSQQQIALPAAPRTNETKPRLGKDEVDILEREFKKNPKPTTQTKRQFAEDMGVELARINVCFLVDRQRYLLTSNRIGFKTAEQSGSKRRSRRRMKRDRLRMLWGNTQNHRRPTLTMAMATMDISAIAI